MFYKQNTIIIHIYIYYKDRYKYCSFTDSIYSFHKFHHI